MYSQTSVREKNEYTASQIKILARHAHTAEQYTAIANYYWSQERIYRVKAVEQMRLWRGRAEMVTRSVTNGPSLWIPRGTCMTTFDIRPHNQPRCSQNVIVLRTKRRSSHEEEGTDNLLGFQRPHASVPTLQNGRQFVRLNSLFSALHKCLEIVGKV